MTKFKYRKFTIYIQTAPVPFAQFVDCYQDTEQAHIGIQDQDSRGMWELKAWAKQAIDRHYAQKAG